MVYLPRTATRWSSGQQGQVTNNTSTLVCSEFCGYPDLARSRELRTKRVREARDEAKKEIDAYRKAKEEEFRKFEAEHTKGNKQAEDEANKEADEKIKEIQSSGKKNQNAVVMDLLKGVLDVKPVAPSTA
ncbi:vacuolar ATPase [Xylaria arbuscula]|nr:vacuolar ATPase [Xylaria arbuscula]